MKMKKLVFVAMVVLVFAMMSGVAFAEGAHGPFNENTDLCASCHRAHTALSDYLLSTEGVTGICTSCHSLGTGADCDVVNGVYITGSGVGSKYQGAVGHAAWGTNASILMGGGFTYVGGEDAASATTSKHFDPAGGSGHLAIPYTLGVGGLGVGGSTIVGSTAGHMDCIDCHIPHSTPNYRMLRLKPNGAAAQIDVADNVLDTARKYTETQGQFNLAKPAVAGGVPGNEGISAWCAACHTYYYKGVATDNNGAARTAGQQDAMSGTYYDVTGLAAADLTYMHAVDADLLYTARNGANDNHDLSTHLGADGLKVGVMPVAASDMVAYDSNDIMTCLTCHRSHGTDTTMVGSAAASRTLGTPTGGTGADVTFSGANASTLLRRDSRGVCEACHNMQAGI